MVRTSWFVHLPLAFCCATALGSVVVDNSLPSAKEIVERYDEALGGREALLRHTSSTMRGTTEVHEAGNVVKLSFVYFASAHYRRLERVSLPNGGVVYKSAARGAIPTALGAKQQGSQPKETPRFLKHCCDTPMTLSLLDKRALRKPQEGPG